MFMCSMSTIQKALSMAVYTHKMTFLGEIFFQFIVLEINQNVVKELYKSQPLKNY